MRWYSHDANFHTGTREDGVTFSLSFVGHNDRGQQLWTLWSNTQTRTLRMNDWDVNILERAARAAAHM